MQKIHMRTWIAVAAALAVVIYFFWQGLWAPLFSRLAGANNAATAVVGADALGGTTAGNAVFGTDTTNSSNTTAVPPIDQTKIATIDIKQGTGATAAAGDKVSVHYDGYLTDGTKFDSSRDRGAPFTFALGTGQVIPGFDQAVTGMKVGGVRRVVIPASLGYGAQQVGKIPANSTLLFEIELLSAGK